jgi:hypothetical protein
VRSAASIQDSLDRHGYAWLKRTEYTEDGARTLCEAQGWRLGDLTGYHIGIEPTDGIRGFQRDWEAIRQERAKKRLRAATKKKEKLHETTLQ